MLKHVPNILTIIRFFLIFPLVAFALNEQYIVAAIVFTISGLTDILDGFIARKYNLISDFGKLMDPLADKLVQISLLIVLTINGILPIWALTIVCVKELAMILGATFLYEKNTVVSSNWYGKAATVIFYFALILSMLNINHYIYFIYFALAFTIFALLMYFKEFMIKKKNLENEESK